MPITDGPGTALKLANAAGDGGGVVLVFTAPEALKILQGAEQQGLIDKVKWACATPCNDASISAALGPAWNDKLGINAELNLVDTTGPDTLNYRAVLKKYAPNVAVGSFSQMGYVSATIAAKALLGIKGDITKKSVNEAFKGIDRTTRPTSSASRGRGAASSTCRTTRTARSCRRTTSSCRRRTASTSPRSRATSSASSTRRRERDSRPVAPGLQGPAPPETPGL